MVNIQVSQEDMDPGPIPYQLAVAHTDGLCIGVQTQSHIGI